MISAAEIAKGLGARRSGPHQWQGRCPSHKDRTPSLSITDGDDGRPLVHCHAGCEQSAVIEALRAKGLWGSNSNSGVSRMLQTAKKTDHGTIILPIPDCAPPPPKAHPEFGEPTATWEYVRDGSPQFYVWRFDPPGGKKEIRPLTYWTTGWHFLGIPEPRPLYGLDRLAENPSAPVVVVEGEKAADAASRIFPDSVCVTSPGGADGAGKCDWTPLAKRQVLIWPDADAAGAGYQQTVTTILQGLDCAISVVGFDGKPAGWDAADAIVGLTDLAALRCEVLEHAKPWESKQEGSKSQNDARKAVLVKANTLKPESISWAWKNRFAFGKLAVIAGDPGLGKSTILIEIAALHSTGGEFPCGEGYAQQCETLILTAEDGLRDTCIPRLMAAGADLSKIHFLTGTKTEGEDGEAMFDLAKDIAVLRTVFKAHPAIRVLIIDPLTAYLGETKAKENTAVRRVLMPLAKLIEDFNICVLANNHLNKGAGKALYRVLDSIAFVAVGRTVHLVIKDADNPDNRKFICDKTNIGTRPLGLTYIIQKTWVSGDQGEEIETSRISWGTSHIDESADEALGDHSDPTMTDDAVDFLKEMLAKGPLGVAAIELEARGAGYLGEDQRLSQSRPFRSARKILKVTTTKDGLAGGWVWALP